MKVNKRLTSIIYSLFMVIGLLLYANYITQIVSAIDKVDSKWYALVLMLSCSMFVYCFVSDIKKLTQKICVVIYTLVAQSILLVEYFLEINILQYVTIALFLGFIVFAVIKYCKVPTIHIVDKREIRKLAETDKTFSVFLTFNICANNICLVSALVLLFTKMSIWVVAIVICVLAIVLTITKHIYSKRYYTKQPILYYLELIYVFYAVFVCSIVPVVCGIYKDVLGNVIMYVISLLVAYLIFERQQVVDEIKRYFTIDN